MPLSEPTADGGFRVPGACPAGIGQTFVWPVALPGGRVTLMAERRGQVRRFDARTGEHAGDPWHVSPYGCAAAAVPDGRTIVVFGGEDGIARYDIVSSAAYQPTAAEQPCIIWDVATATLPSGRAVIAGAGHDGLLYRWDAATGGPVGEPLQRHHASVKAITTAVSGDGTPMFVSGCEKGDVLRCDAATGAPLGAPLTGTIDEVSQLTVVSLPSGGQILACVDAGALHRWDLTTSEPLGPPAAVGRWGYLVGSGTEADGTPTVFLWLPGEGDDEDAVERVEQWRLDTGERVDVSLPVTVRAVFDQDGAAWMVLDDPDGALIVRSLSPSGAGPG